MRILFLDHPQYISGSARLWQGLNEMLPGAVTLYPHIPTHYGAPSVDLAALPWFERMSSAAARGEMPYGVPLLSKGETLCNTGQTVIINDGQPFIPPMPEHPPDEEDVVRQLREGKYDLVILANSNRVPTIALGRLMAQTKMPPIVYYDAGERDELNEHWIHVFQPAMVFKQILTPAVLKTGLTVKISGYSLRMFPLPLSSMFADHPHFRFSPTGPSVGELRSQDGPEYKTIDLYYPLGETWPTRKPVVDALDALTRRRGYRTAPRLSFPEYNLSISRSRLAVSMRGSGRDAIRYCEIPLYRTAMVCDGTMGCIHPHPFTDGETAIFFDTIESLVDIVDRQLTDTSDRLDEIAKAGKNHLEKYHTTSARAVFFLDRVREVLGVRPDGNQEEGVMAWKRRRAWDSQVWEGPVVTAQV